MKTNHIRSIILVLIAALAIASNRSVSIASEPTKKTTDAEGISDLAGTSWQLVKIQYSDEKTLMPDDRSKYTITFGADGQVAARIDCNRGSGAWKSAGPNQLEFGPLATTRVMCPPGSLYDRIVKDWSTFRSYVIKDGHLFLSLMADGGIYEFEPLGGSQVSLFGKRWKLTQVRGTTVTTNKPYIEFDEKAKRFSGDGGCNRVAGNFEINGTQIKFSQAVSTKRACIDRAMQQVETEFFAALEEVNGFRIEGEVLLLTAGDQTILAFRADSGGTAGPAKEGRVTGTISYR
jgi:heat shock protein HslJ